MMGIGDEIHQELVAVLGPEGCLVIGDPALAPQAMGEPLHLGGVPAPGGTR